MSEPGRTSYPRKKINILLLENISRSAVDAFEAAGYKVVCRPGAMTEEELIKEIKDIHLLGIRSKTRITADILREAKKLQAIGCFCIGTNQVDINTARKQGVVVFNAPYSNTRSVAELVIGAAIMLLRRVLPKNQEAHAGRWMKDANGAHELRGKTIGIAGYGNIGSQVSVLAEAMGMKVFYYDIAKKLPLGNANAVKSIEELVSVSDIVTLHVPETLMTKGMINSEILGRFKKDAILINYARGEVVDLQALKVALMSGNLGGAAIDVFPSEPEKNGADFSSPLQGIDNVLLTPHIGGSTEEAQENIGDDVSNKLLQYMEMGITLGSHTLPQLSLPPAEGAHRILHIHNNVPGVLSDINKLLSDHHANILGQYLKTNEEIGYVVLDVDADISESAVQLLSTVKETIRTRVVY